MITIILFDKTKEIRKHFDGNINWCYIGKDISSRENLVEMYGENKIFYLKNRLHEVAEELRQPFLDFVSNIGGMQKNKLNWWASRFASKSPFQTDFFLLLCYEGLIQKIIEEVADRSESICLIVEDPWLFVQLKVLNCRGEEIIYIGNPCLYLHKLLWLGRGIIYRLMLIMYLIIQKWTAYYYCGQNIADSVKTKKGAVALLSYVDENVFTDTENIYDDKYLGGDMENFLLSKGIPVIRLTYLKFLIRLMPKCSINADTIWPLILDLRLKDMIVTAFMWWRPEVRNNTKMMVNKTPLDILFERQKWDEFRLTAFNQNLMYYYSVSDFLARDWCKVLIYTFENQPFEKMICLAGKRYPDVKLIGYRNAHSPWFYLSLFLGRKECEFVPLPTRIITIGNHTLEMFRKTGGYPDGILRNGGAWRFTHLWKDNCKVKERIESKTVLVATPVDPSITRSILLNLKKEFCNVNSGITFLIKCHPSTPFSSLGIEMDNNRLFNIVDDPIEKLLNNVDIVIYAVSTVGLESLVRGKKVIRFIPENLIVADPLDGISSDLYYSCHEGDCLEAVLKALKTNITEKKVSATIQLKQEYFDKINYDLWLKEINLSN